MTRRRVVFGGPLWELPEPGREAWKAWLRDHGLDPFVIPAESTLDVDDAENVITYESFERHSPRDGGGRVMHVDADGKATAVRRQVRLHRAGPVAPFPADGYAWTVLP